MKLAEKINKRMNGVIRGAKKVSKTNACGEGATVMGSSGNNGT